MDDLVRSIIKPKCGRCLRDVDSAVAQSVVVTGVAGQKLTYKCHGEVAEYEITSEWYDRLTKEKRPFVVEVFKPLPEQTPVEKDQIIREDAVLKLREQRKIVAEFIESTIRQTIEALPAYKGENLAEWCVHHSVRLESLYGHLIDHARDVRRLVMGQNTVLGTFELPFFPDDTNMAWHATTTAERKAKK